MVDTTTAPNLDIDAAASILLGLESAVTQASKSKRVSRSRGKAKATAASVTKSKKSTGKSGSPSSKRKKKSTKGTCEVCGKTFAHRNYLKVHMRFHTGEKPYICTVCNKAFAHSSHLKVHHRIHTGEKPYTCKICKKGFTSSGHLKAHTRVHTGEKPYVCKICGKAYAYSSHFKVHMRVHTGEKPYKCTICSKAFANSSHMKGHMKTHLRKKRKLANQAKSGSKPKSPKTVANISPSSSSQAGSPSIAAITTPTLSDTSVSSPLKNPNVTHSPKKMTLTAPALGHGSRSPLQHSLTSSYRKGMAGSAVATMSRPMVTGYVFPAGSYQYVPAEYLTDTNAQQQSQLAQKRHLESQFGGTAMVPSLLRPMSMRGFINQNQSLMSNVQNVAQMNPKQAVTQQHQSQAVHTMLSGMTSGYTRMGLSSVPQRSAMTLQLPNSASISVDAAADPSASPAHTSIMMLNAQNMSANLLQRSHSVVISHTIQQPSNPVQLSQTTTSMKADTKSIATGARITNLQPAAPAAAAAPAIESKA